MTSFGIRNTKASKLTPTQVQEIREFYAKGAVSQGQLARDYQVSIVTIGRIVRGEVWQQLESRQPTHKELDESAQRLLAVQRDLEVGGMGSGLAKLAATTTVAGETVNTMLTEIRSPLDE